MSKANISILLVLLSVVIVGGVYLYVYKPNMESKDAVQAEINTLQARYDDLNAKAQKKISIWQTLQCTEQILRMR